MESPLKKLKNSISKNDDENFNIEINMGNEYKRHKIALYSLKVLKELKLDWDITFCIFNITFKLIYRSNI